MSLLDDAIVDAKDIIEGEEGATVLVLFTSPPEADLPYLPNTEIGTLDPEDIDNIIRGWPGDHFTQYNPDTGDPQEGLNAKLTITLKTLLDKVIIDSVNDPDLTHWKLSWLDLTAGTRRDFMVNSIRPTNTLGWITILLGELEVEEE